MLEQLYSDLTTFHLFPNNLRVVLNMLQQLYRNLATFFLFSRILRVVLNLLEQLYRHLGPSTCSQATSELF